MSNRDFLVPLLYAGWEGVVELFMDLQDVLDFVEDGVDLLHGQDGLGCCGCGFQGPQGLQQPDREKNAIFWLNKYTTNISNKVMQMNKKIIIW